jgi:hypothetical protein
VSRFLTSGYRITVKKRLKAENAGILAKYVKRRARNLFTESFGELLFPGVEKKPTEGDMSGDARHLCNAAVESAGAPAGTALELIRDMRTRNPRLSAKLPGFRLLLAALALGALSALSGCKLPEQKQAHYPNGFLKERYWVYREGGSEVMHGLYTSWFPNGEREVEILYRDGSEILKTYFTDRGSVVGTVDLASLREP